MRAGLSRDGFERPDSGAASDGSSGSGELRPLGAEDDPFCSFELSIT